MRSQRIVSYEELEQVFDHFHKYHTKILLGDFNAKVGRENIFKPTIRQENFHQDMVAALYDCVGATSSFLDILKDFLKTSQVKDRSPVRV